MDKSTGLKYLREILDQGLENRSSIANKLGMHPSQVSRIVNGNFSRMSGNALEVCKFARMLSAKYAANNSNSNLLCRLEEGIARLVQLSPEAAEALTEILGVLVEKAAGKPKI